MESRKNMVTSSGISSGAGDYVQFFLYRVPKKNHDAMMELERRIEDGWKKYGILHSEFFQLTPHETIGGFTNFAERISAQSDEEVWVETQHYRSREHRDEIFAAVRKDTPLLELFGKWYGLVAQGENSTMGNFTKLRI